MMKTHNSRIRRALGAAACASALTLLAACGNEAPEGNEVASEKENEPAQQEVNQEPLPAGVVPAALIVNGEDAPEGYSYEPPSQESQGSLDDLMGETGPEDVPVVEPAQCAGAIVDGATFLDWLSRPSETTAVAHYTSTSNEDEGIQVMLSTEPADPSQYPKDASECATATKISNNEYFPTEKKYEISPADIKADGADVLSATQTKLVFSKVKGEEETVDGETLYVLTGSVRGAHFTIASTTSLSAEEFSKLATAQAQRISEAQ
ncbi:hypothetical protein [Corynebacterium suicordis]|uniref:DUF5642 domain-containing protein n=1 Tax=Corynebacterium suicordis DSM 45110 TaxID=1121369 RepID=A0ABR9ZI02_9CORY|nr:hypothetical protein [Corynebacterium suicordis]MBF4553082.1 hypothetical protein [Corynebacterium suicordis DSM 45110]MDR6277955.1 hypothetical protein [Corynebacterium suicordis]